MPSSKCSARTPSRSRRREPPDRVPRRSRPRRRPSRRPVALSRGTTTRRRGCPAAPPRAGRRRRRPCRRRSAGCRARPRATAAPSPSPMWSWRMSTPTAPASIAAHFSDRPRYSPSRPPWMAPISVSALAGRFWVRLSAAAAVWTSKTSSCWCRGLSSRSCAAGTPAARPILVDRFVTGEPVVGRLHLRQCCRVQAKRLASG